LFFIQKSDEIFGILEFVKEHNYLLIKEDEKKKEEKTKHTKREEEKKHFC
jgi:hypothetical protein